MVLYLLTRRFLPGRGAVKGLIFGLFLLSITATELLASDGYEFTRYVSPAVSVPFFLSLYLIYGPVLAVVAERLGRGEQGPPRNRWLRVGGRIVLVAAVVASLGALHQELNRSYGFM
jgi:hypothetical protein